MPFSTLLDSFNRSTTRGLPSEGPGDTARSKKRRKLEPPHGETTTNEQYDSNGADIFRTWEPTSLGKEPTSGLYPELSSGTNMTTLHSYKSHYDLQELVDHSLSTETIFCPSLGKITVSNTSLIQETHLINSRELSRSRELKIPFEQPLRSDNTTSVLFHCVSQYSDVVYTNPSIPKRKDLRNLVCSHALEHILMTRQIVLKNNEWIAKNQNAMHRIDDKRDQGFTRPKVLFLLPTRNSCYEAVNILANMAKRDVLENKVRFTEEYGPGGQSRMFQDNKPEEFKELFRGNNDDMFRIGIKITRKTMKLFSKFYHSDIILASPLGLKAIIGTTEKNPGDTDFLSSIEVLYLDSTEALLMQNWDHVETVFNVLNQTPKNSHGCDFSRIKNWYLDGSARKYRQTIISGSFLTPEINSILSKHCQNHKGFIKFHEHCPGELSRHIPQVFTKVPSLSPANDPDSRFDYFTTSMVPKLKNDGLFESGGLLIFLPSYLDCLRLRSYFTNVGLGFGEINEYSPQSSVTRSRALFASGRYKILLYTERVHHFRRYALKGVINVFMYALPANPIFYKEIIGFLRDSITHGDANLEHSKIQALFSQWDALKLERIVGATGYTKIRNNDDSGRCIGYEFP
ncbi:rRNA-binding ribosome biosynthesis protein utp25 [Orbilia ellipsospora]|uniref:U3 small nucleolar RNA-associated protein 25 n=1 Tax=Orbilia ellipsospora TaxID=2528407 RepID=A0AAV9X5Q3_9PEZI